MGLVKHTFIVAKDNADMSIGERIKARREELRLEAIDLATAAHVTVQSVYQWESISSRGLKPVNLVSIAKLLNTTEEWLATGRGERERPVSSSVITADEAELLANYRVLPDDGKAAVRAIVRQLGNPSKSKEGSR